MAVNFSTDETQIIMCVMHRRKSSIFDLKRIKKTCITLYLA